MQTTAHEHINLNTKQIPNYKTKYDNVIHVEGKVVCTPSAQAGYTTQALVKVLSYNHGRKVSLPKVVIISHLMAIHSGLARFQVVTGVSVACRLEGRLLCVLLCFLLAGT